MISSCNEALMLLYLITTTSTRKPAIPTGILAGPGHLLGRPADPRPGPTGTGLSCTRTRAGAGQGFLNTITRGFGSGLPVG